jgi:hypothetical protein
MKIPRSWHPKFGMSRRIFPPKIRVLAFSRPNLRACVRDGSAHPTLWSNILCVTCVFGEAVSIAYELTTGKKDFAVQLFARQRMLYARQRFCRATPHDKGRTAMPLTAKVSLPCDSPTLHGKGFAVRRRTRQRSLLSRVQNMFHLKKAPN